MKVTMKLPKSVMPVVRILRRDVPRPKNPPKLFKTGVHVAGWIRGGRRCCPMGLHPKATSGLPIFKRNFCDDPTITDESVKLFFEWWDLLELNGLPKAAYEAIWPKGRDDA